MKKNSIIAVIAAVVIIGGILVLLSPKSKTEDHGAMHPSTSASVEKPVDANTVLISNYTFSPTPLKVKMGTKVTWINHDIARHTITTDAGQPAGGPDSQLFGKNESYSFTFNSVGSYNYHCSPHPYMHGVVEVTP